MFFIFLFFFCWLGGGGGAVTNKCISILINESGVGLAKTGSPILINELGVLTRSYNTN